MMLVTYDIWSFRENMTLLALSDFTKFSWASTVPRLPDPGEQVTMLPSDGPTSGFGTVVSLHFEPDGTPMCTVLWSVVPGADKHWDPQY